MLDNKVASCRKRSQRPQPRTKDGLHTLQSSGNFLAVKSDSERMKTLSNVNRRQPSKSTLASGETYLELLPSMEEMPTPSRGSGQNESPARPAIELNRYVLSRFSKRIVLTKMIDVNLDELASWDRRGASHKMPAKVLHYFTPTTRGILMIY